MQIVGLLGMYSDAVVVEVKTFSLLFMLTLAILCQLCLTIKLFFFSLITIFFSIFFFLIFAICEAIYLGIEEVRLNLNQKNPFKFIKPQHGSFFTLTKIKLDHVIFQLQFKNNWLMWLWFLLWFFLNISPVKWFRFFFVKVKAFYGIFEASVSRLSTTGSNSFESHFDNPSPRNKLNYIHEFETS